MSTISIRSAQIEDLKTLLEFEQGVIESEKPLDPFLGDGNLHYYNIKELITSESIAFLVAISGVEIVGSGYLRIQKSKHYHKNPLHGYIGFMYVKPNFRGKRISSLILESLKNFAKKKNLKELRLDVYHNNLSAINSYERFGFTKSLMNMRMKI